MYQVVSPAISGIGIAAVESKLNSLDIDKKSYSTTQVATHRKPNAAGYISTLPPELLALVLQHAMEAASTLRLRELATVCKLWQDVVRTTPALWDLLDWRHSEEFNRLILKKNKGNTLRVWCQQSRLSDDGLGKLQTFLQLAIANVKRWREINYNVGHPQLNLIEALQFATSIETIEISAPLRDTKLVLAPTARLRRLHLIGVGLNWSRVVPSLCGIQDLQLEDLSILPKTSQLLVILASSPYLFRFHVTCFIPSPESSENHDEDLADAIHLPRLRSLYLGLPDTMVTQLLFCITAPKASNVVIRGMEAESFDRHISGAFPSTISSILNSAGFVSVVRTDGVPAMQIEAVPPTTAEDPAPDPTMILSVTRVVQPEWEAIASLLGSYPRLPIQIILNHVDSSSATPTELAVNADILDGTLKIGNLTLTGLCSKIVETLCFIARPPTGANGQRAWICPHLSRLCIDPDWTPNINREKHILLEALEEFAENRFISRLPAFSNKGTFYSTPKNLKTIIAPNRIAGVLKSKKAWKGVEILTLESEDAVHLRKPRTLWSRLFGGS